MDNVIDILEKRGLLEAKTSDSIRGHVQKPISVYCGFDPTADSLHLGNLVAIMGLAWFQRCGHTPYVIVGGATGMVGDPSGKRHERPLLDEETIRKNLKGIQQNIETVLRSQNTSAKPVILNNFNWFKEMSLIDFLRDAGKFARMGPMLGKESVKTRLESEEGLSFTEFTYQLLQGYDFLYLFEKYGVSIQLGGSDQWGNIIAGTDLIRKVKGGEGFGLTFPLLTTADGKKFGKSEKGAIWLSEEKCSPYEMYQYLVRSRDEDVIRLMGMLTFMEMDEIEQIREKMKAEDYIPNTAQKRLAEEVTRIVHGDEGVEVSLKVTSGASPGAKAALDSKTLEVIAKDMPSFAFSKEELIGLAYLDLLVRVGLQTSKGRARDLIRSGGFYLNNERVESESGTVQESHLLDGKFLLLASGRKNKVIVSIS